MAIKQAANSSWRLPSWMTECDYCGKNSQKYGMEPGDAAENARKEGFSTVLFRHDIPMKWKCRPCSQANGKVVAHA